MALIMHCSKCDSDHIQEDTCQKDMIAKKSNVNYLQVGPDICDLIRQECDKLAGFLIEKNLKYGNAALNPKRIMSRADPREQILIRMDDKLSRMLENKTDDHEDAVKDFVGYYILLQVYDRLQKDEPAMFTNCTTSSTYTYSLKEKEN